MALIKSSYAAEGRARIEREAARLASIEAAEELSGAAAASVEAVEAAAERIAARAAFHECLRGECDHRTCGICGSCLETEAAHNDGFCKYLEKKLED